MNPINRIIANTAILYAKLLIVMLLSLVSVRLVLAALGETNYGIYSLVAGVVGMLGLLQNVLSNASMRFMAYSLGTNDDGFIAQTFNTTLFLHFLIGIGVVLLIEIGGFFMFKYLLNIPNEKIYDAKLVFHFMTITTFVAIIAVPYDAVINSHENLFFLSLIDIIGAVLKFGVAVFLSYSHSNLLIMYGFLLMLIQLLMRITKQWYSTKFYKECKIEIKHYNKTLAKSILSFSTWNLLGSIASMSVTQIRGILLNMFFGVGMNAANGIAMQVSGQVNAVSSSMTRALNPQLVKSEGGGNRKRMLRLTELSTKYSVFLFAIFAIPVIIDMPYLFKIWLKDIPEYSIIFSRLILIGLLVDKLTFEITSAIRAVGEIKNFQISETLLVLFNIPISYLFFKMGFPPYSIYLISLFIGILAIAIRLYFGKQITLLNISGFLKKGIFPILIPMMLSLIPIYFLRPNINEPFAKFVLTTSFFIISFCTSFYLFGVSNEEKAKIHNLILLLKKKLTH